MGQLWLALLRAFRVLQLIRLSAAAAAAPVEDNHDRWAFKRSRIVFIKFHGMHNYIAFANPHQPLWKKQPNWFWNWFWRKIFSRVNFKTIDKKNRKNQQCKKINYQKALEGYLSRNHHQTTKVTAARLGPIKSVAIFHVLGCEPVQIDQTEPPEGEHRPIQLPRRWLRRIL